MAYLGHTSGRTGTLRKQLKGIVDAKKVKKTK